MKASAISLPLENERVRVRRFTPDDWRDIHEIALSNAASEFAFCDEQWPTDEGSAKAMCEYMATDENMFAIYAKDVGRVVCFVNFNSVSDDKYLDIGHVMNASFAGNGYEYEGLKLLCEAALAETDLAGFRAYWALDDAVKLEPLYRLGMKVVGTHENKYFGGKEGTFTGCELKATRADFQAVGEGAGR